MNIQQNRIVSRTFFALVITAAVLFGACSSPAKGMDLVIQNAESGVVWEKLPVQEGDEFAVEFTHSVHKSPVRETFVVEGTAFRPVMSRFYSFGAGMQSDLEEGQVMSFDNGAICITGFNASFGELIYIVDGLSNYRLIVGDRTIDLLELCGKNAHVALGIASLD